MHQRKSKKILVYFFLLILLGSINNITLSELNYMKINHIKVSGLNNRENNELLKKLQELDLGNIFLLNKEKITTIIDRNTTIENYKVHKKYPSTLDIEIKKTNFLAKLNYDDSIYVVGNNGRLSKDTYEANGLPFIFGKPNIKDFLKFKEIIDDSKISFNQIENLYFFPSERWDLQLENNILVKLPKQHIKSTLDNIFEMLNDQNFEDIKIFDARVKNQIILNE